MIKIHNHYALETKKNRNSLTDEQILETMFHANKMTFVSPVVYRRLWKERSKFTPDVHVAVITRWKDFGSC